MLFLIQKKFNQETKIMVNLILLKLVPFSIDQTIDWYVFADWHLFTFHTLNTRALSVILSVSVMLGRVLQKAVCSERNDSGLIFAHRFFAVIGKWYSYLDVVWTHNSMCFPTHAPSTKQSNKKLSEIILSFVCTIVEDYLLRFGVDSLTAIYCTTCL